MATFQISQRPLRMLVGVVVLHIILISAQVTTTAGIPVIQVVTFGAFAELQRAVMGAIGAVQSVWTEYVALRDVEVQNAALRRELRALQVELQQVRAQAQRTDSLRRLLDLREHTSVETTAAEIIGAAPDPEFRTLTIDKGTSDGLRADMAVIAPAGVVGRVILPSLRAAKVQLLIDASAAAGAMIERSRAQGVVIGQGTRLRMEYVPGSADVQVGDLVVTSGIDGVYPKGFVIGTVDRVERGPGTFHDIVVRPTVDFSRLEEVLVVLTPPPAAGTDGDAAPSAPVSSEDASGVPPGVSRE
ncbi:MAG: rod shape-determining protein MreC [Acidobacteriota bacterium]